MVEVLHLMLLQSVRSSTWKSALTIRLPPSVRAAGLCPTLGFFACEFDGAEASCAERCEASAEHGIHAQSLTIWDNLKCP